MPSNKRSATPTPVDTLPQKGTCDATWKMALDTVKPFRETLLQLPAPKGLLYRESSTSQCLVGSSWTHREEF